MQIPRICGIVLVIGFFLPFVSVMGVSCSGYDLVKGGQAIGGMAEGLGGMGDMGGESAAPKQDNPAILMKIVALIPIAGLISAIVDKKIVYMISGFVPIAILLAWTAETSGGVFNGLAIGAWLCIAAGITQLVTAGRSEMATADEGGGIDPGGGDEPPPESQA